MNAPSETYRIETARHLNRGGVSAAPLSRLPILSIFDDEEYENYDLDAIPPTQRLRLIKILEGAGFRHASGRVLKAPDGGAQLEFPKPSGLGSDPSRPAADLVARGDRVVLVTPTQAILLHLHRWSEADEASVVEELASLVWEQPANLDKIYDWARAAQCEKPFLRMRPQLETAQAEGVSLRKRKRFKSRLPS